MEAVDAVRGDIPNGRDGQTQSGAGISKTVEIGEVSDELEVIIVSNNSRRKNPKFPDKRGLLVWVCSIA